MTRSSFGKLPDGRAVEALTLSNGGMQARIMTYGAAVVSLTAPDKNGKYADIVLGMDGVDGYVKGVPYFGAVVGRYGNRIGKGTFQLDGKTYKLAVNNGENALHGGLKGFDKQIWTAREANGGVEFTYVSKDGEEGYPGNTDGEGALHADAAERTADRVHRDDGQADGREPDEPHVLQPGGRGRHSRSTR